MSGFGEFKLEKKADPPVSLESFILIGHEWVWWISVREECMSVHGLRESYSDGLPWMGFVLGSRVSGRSPLRPLACVVAGSGGDVPGPGGGGAEHPKGQDPWHVDEGVLPLPETPRLLRQRLPRPPQVPAGEERVGGK